LGFNSKITLIVVGRDHKVVFFPTSEADADRSGNCPAGTVIDSGVVAPTHFNYYLHGHAVQLGMSKPAHYTTLLDENNFTYVILS
jgi:eukaryotic translation initiation factor 2C